MIMIRLILPIPRVHIPAEQLAQPIPSLTDRQYVVDKSRKSAEQLKVERELFWYRDILLKSLHATWIEVSPVSTARGGKGVLINALAWVKTVR